jgi:SAM-dependent methyltransferase
MDPEYARKYRDLYERHWWWRAREGAILGELHRRQPGGGWRRILDIGCGDGLFFDQLSQFGRVEGVEPDVGLLDPGGRWRRFIHAVPFDQDFRPAHRYDVILMLDVVEHLQDPARALAHARTLLEPAGILLVTVPAFPWLWTRHDDYNHHVQRFTRGTFRRIAEPAGLRILDERYLFQWLVPAKLAVRALESLRPGRSSTASVPRWPWNGLLFLVSRFELAVTRALPMPFGSSLLVIAEAMPHLPPERDRTSGEEGQGSR